MAVAAKLKGEERRVVAVIGDGAMTAGMAFEALNNAGAMDANLLVILNDNDMSISANVGALNSYLTKLLSGRFYNNLRSRGERLLANLAADPRTGQAGRRTHQGHGHAGHAVRGIRLQLSRPDRRPRSRCADPDAAQHPPAQGPAVPAYRHPQGQGLRPCRSESLSVSRRRQVRRRSGHQRQSLDSRPTYTEIFSRWLCDMAAADSRLVGITPAMCEGSGLNDFAERFPERYFDVGIAEQHALTFAAGLACEGRKPVVAIYSTFLQRAYDQLIHDIALQNLPVLLAIDRAGLVGADGPTHAGAFDISFLRCIPNMLIATPSDENECRQLLTTAYPFRRPQRRALSARHRPGRRRSADAGQPADRQGHRAPPGHSGLPSWPSAAW
jgi:1-deoxy-D-xylulose-5-phosphate synthase